MHIIFWREGGRGEGSSNRSLRCCPFLISHLERNLTYDWKSVNHYKLRLQTSLTVNLRPFLFCFTNATDTENHRLVRYHFSTLLSLNCNHVIANFLTRGGVILHPIRAPPPLFNIYKYNMIHLYNSWSIKSSWNNWII